MPDELPRYLTLAQLARRAGLSDGRARAIHAKTPERMPRPDATDGNDRPLWLPETVDAWAAVRRARRMDDLPDDALRGEMLRRSSLGTPGVLALAARTSAEAVAEILHRARKIEASGEGVA